MSLKKAIYLKDNDEFLKGEQMKALRALKIVLKDTILTSQRAYLEEAIAELEEAMKPKTCKGCVHEVGDMQDLYCAFCSRSCDDNFEPKDNA